MDYTITSAALQGASMIIAFFLIVLVFGAISIACIRKGHTFSGLCLGSICLITAFFLRYMYYLTEL